MSTPPEQPMAFRPTPADVGWSTCTEEPDCIGRQLTEGGPCLTHADKDQRAEVYQRLTDGAPLDMTAGVAFTEELLAELLEHLPRTDDNRMVLHAADLRFAILPSARLHKAQFTKGAWFGSAQFTGNATFTEARFTGNATFTNARFMGNALFSQAQFEGDAWVWFNGVQFDGVASFNRARFEGLTWFDFTRFQGQATFSGAQFMGDTSFSGTHFMEGAWFTWTQFTDAWFDGAQFEGNATFDHAVIAWPSAGSMAVSGSLTLDEVVFVEPVHFQPTARRLSCRGTRFKAGGHLRVAWAEISLEDAEISAPLTLSAHPPEPELVERVPWLTDPYPEDPDRQFPPPMPSLVSVQCADVAHLTVTDIDLADCHFAGAHHLDQLTITTSGRFHHAPHWWEARRHVLAEEAERRVAQGATRIPFRRWWLLTSQEFRSPLLNGARKPSPSELAGIYRQLRKGREDAKNESGAADFYYGEMEMRRHASSAPRAERWLLTRYWLTSGYALRAWRALTCLAILVGLVTALLSVYGLPDQNAAASAGSPTQAAPAGASPMPRSAIEDRVTLSRVGTAVYIAVNGAVFRRIDAQLTPAGRAVELIDRVLGPVLLGLVLLSIRNRVKR